MKRYVSQLRYGVRLIRLRYGVRLIRLKVRDEENVRTVYGSIYEKGIVELLKKRFSRNG